VVHSCCGVFDPVLTKSHAYQLAFTIGLTVWVTITGSVAVAVAVSITVSDAAADPDASQRIPLPRRQCRTSRHTDHGQRFCFPGERIHEPLLGRTNQGGRSVQR
jgi:hypothetical protein